MCFKIQCFCFIYSSCSTQASLASPACVEGVFYAWPLQRALRGTPPFPPYQRRGDQLRGVVVGVFFCWAVVSSRDSHVIVMCYILLCCLIGQGIKPLQLADSLYKSGSGEGDCYTAIGVASTKSVNIFGLDNDFKSFSLIVI